MYEFEESGFDSVIIEIKNNDTITSECSRGGTCSLISGLFGLSKLEDVSELDMTDFLRYIIDKAYEKLNLQNGSQIYWFLLLYPLFFN